MKFDALYHAGFMQPVPATASLVWLRFAVQLEEFERTLPGFWVGHAIREWVPTQECRRTAQQKYQELHRRMVAEARCANVSPGDVEEARRYYETGRHEDHVRELARLEGEFKDAVTYRKVSTLPGEDPVEYSAFCGECRQAVRASARADLVRRHENVPEEPTDRRLRLFDFVSGDAEKRMHNREVDRIEKWVEEKARHELWAAGCPHVRGVEVASGTRVPPR